MRISLIEFSVENFKIFKKRATLSTIARKSSHTFENNDENLLRTSLIYGPNASGKSTLLQALDVMKGGILNSANNPSGAMLPYFNFTLSEETETAPIFWEAIFSLEKRVFKYNFSILKDRVIEENLFGILSDGKEKKYITRKENNIELFEDFKNKDSEDVKSKTRKEVLFLSAVAQWNNKLAMEIIEGFKNINILQGPNSDLYGGFSLNLFKKDADTKEKMLNFLKRADFCISDGVVEKVKIPEIVMSQLRALNSKENYPETADVVVFSHKKFNSKNEQIGFQKINMSDESIGTKKFFDVLGPVIDTIENGKVLLIDEFDNSLHPLLTKFIIDIFEKSNPHNAQLIATTHDTSLLSYKDDFDKTQFWFTEKDEFGAAKLFSLAEFKMRNDTEFSKKYLEGRFGALPFIESTN